MPSALWWRDPQPAVASDGVGAMPLPLLRNARLTI